MKRIKLTRSQHPVTVPGSQVQATISVRSRCDRTAKPISATIWIVVAWLIGTLISGLNLVGAEPVYETFTIHPFDAPESILKLWSARETEFALTQSSIDEFNRVHRRIQMRPLYDSLIAEENSEAAIATKSVGESVSSVPESDARPQPGSPTQQTVSTAAAANPKTLAGNESTVEQPSAADQPKTATLTRPVDPSVELAFDQIDEQTQDGSTPRDMLTTFAWKGFSEDTIPGLVNLVVHSFNELMTPVHVSPLATEEAVVSVADDQSHAKVSVAYVDADTQESTFSADSEVAMDAEPNDVDPTPAVEQLANDTVHDETLLRQPPRKHAQIVRTRPQLLRVTEPSVMMLAPAINSNRELARTLSTNGQRSVVSPVSEVGERETARPEARLAAKWPFERAAPTDLENVTLNVDNADVRTVFEMLARGYHMNILVSPDVDGVVTANVDGLSPEQTLQGIVKMCSLNMQTDNDLIYIYPSDKIPADARELRIFPLDFARAESLEPTVQGLLSPVGNAYTSKMDDSDNMRTQESIVVVDIPSVLAQIENFLMQADQAPRQVLIEARVLEVELSDEMIHGINFGAILSGDAEIGGFGFAQPTVSSANPTFFARIDGSRLSAILDFLETTTDSKTLASPRVQVVNGQNARIQVGQQLGFTVATVTQTSTIQDVQFLETGVVLSVTPTISRDNRILMEVKPEVSDGEINPTTLLPEEETREVETSVLLDNHEGVIIGGLIQEKDRTVIKKLPWLGDVRYIGKFFQRREVIRSRSEIIVALVPHIIERCVQDERSTIGYERTETPLLYGPLQRVCRPWEPRLPDTVGADQHMDVNRVNRNLP